MNNLKLLFFLLFIPGLIIILIGFYMLSQDISSTGITMRKYTVGDHETITGESAIITGSFVLLMIPFALLFQFVDNRKNKRFLNLEAKRDMEGKSQKSLQYEFNKLLDSFSIHEQDKQVLWQEIADSYSEKHRKYHTLKHLEQLFELLNDLKWEITNWNAISFAVFYHDIVYDPSSAVNEEESAEIAVKRMTELGIDHELVKQVKALIIATKTHIAFDDKDVKLFLDADLAILGENSERYDLYAKMVREEFSIYDDRTFNGGRIKVLQHFLSKDRIYQTGSFRARFEKTARLNLERELKLLQGN